MKKLTFIFSFIILIGYCTTLHAQQSIDAGAIDNYLTSIYKKFSDNRHDYGGNYGEARDTILIRFQNTLAETLRKESFLNVKYDSLSEYMRIIASEDDKLKIISWDEFNGGTWHVYNSMYQYKVNNELAVGFLTTKTDDQYSTDHTEVYHYQIQLIDKDKYLAKAYGTHGSGKEFYVFRLLSFRDGVLKDCDSCFNGDDKFIYEISRGHDELIPQYNSETKEIAYHELEESYIDGDLDSPSGFMKATGKILKLRYENGAFIPLEK
ncbi:hypothetical protein Celal_3863 [Cellulophaga algicola DSM 14237]|uniref:MORN variant repeat-containing protein n=1 Tax=Cellulophaga algicola (strain DSM 14237 / IC166 / ACAM 630) TaxID=688270 RepID=E6XBJ7_CELAD|nr:hypothetical protein [Cellulophaga algicola]ADV51110.1 hypothetical protein Celal_3863 [Cellulophaga algicola DSM 14237]